jgi:hypothetical protein
MKGLGCLRVFQFQTNRMDVLEVPEGRFFLGVPDQA